MNEQRPSGVAWNLSRLGAEVSQRFARRLAPLGLSPSDAAVLRAVGQGEAAQREIADHLGSAPSRIVALIDGLESRGLVTRTIDPHDRRRRVVSLTDAGREALGQVRRIATHHDAEIIAGLDGTAVDELRRLLGQVQENLGMSPGGHPGMR